MKPAVRSRRHYLRWSGSRPMAKKSSKEKQQENSEAGKRFEDLPTPGRFKNTPGRTCSRSAAAPTGMKSVPMIGTPGNLRRDDLSRSMRTNSVSLDPKHGDCSVFFNRGIISTQAIARALQKSKAGLPNTAELKKKIAKPDDPIRARAWLEVSTAGFCSFSTVPTRTGGECYCALYELADHDPT